MKSLPINEGAFTVLLEFECSSMDSEKFALELGDFLELLRFSLAPAPGEPRPHSG